MSKIKPPSKEVQTYIRENYSYDSINGQIDGPLKRNVGWVEKTHNMYYVKILIFKRKIRRSHIVWFLNKGWWPRLEIDHIDRNSLNDLIDNLMEVTIYEQVENRKNSKMYKGFSIHLRTDKKRNKPWRVRNQKHGIDLKNYESEEAAKKAVDEFVEKGGKWWI